jgi:hypothetical protein
MGVCNNKKLVSGAIQNWVVLGTFFDFIFWVVQRSKDSNTDAVRRLKRYVNSLLYDTWAKRKRKRKTTTSYF